MAIHHKIPRSRGGSDDEWNLVEYDDYTHAYEHALDFVLFPEISPWFDNRQAGWNLLPDDLKDAVKQTQSERRKVEYLGGDNPNFGNSVLKGVPRPLEVCEKIRAGLSGKPKSPEHRAALAASRRGKKTGPQGLEARRNKSEGARKGWETRRRNAKPN